MREFKGVLECMSDKLAFVREVSIGFAQKQTDPFVLPDMVRQYHLRPGVFLEGTAQENRRGKSATCRMSKRRSPTKTSMGIQMRIKRLPL